MKKNFKKLTYDSYTQFIRLNAIHFCSLVKKTSVKFDSQQKKWSRPIFDLKLNLNVSARSKRN